MQCEMLFSQGVSGWNQVYLYLHTYQFWRAGYNQLIFTPTENPEIVLATSDTASHLVLVPQEPDGLPQIYCCAMTDGSAIFISITFFYTRS